MIDIKEQHLKMVREIFKKHPYTFYVYGSRAKEKARKNSDLDLCYKEEIPERIIFKIKEELEESDLPFKVDIVNWESMKPAFQKLIEKNLKLI